MASSPTARTKQRLQAAGYVVGIVEKWNQHGNGGKGIRVDLFGFADLLAVRCDKPGALFVQATTAGHISHRLEKIRQEPRVRTVLLASNRVEIWGWRKRKSGLWDVTRRVVGIEDLEPVGNVHV